MLFSRFRPGHFPSAPPLGFGRTRTGRPKRQIPGDIRVPSGAAAPIVRSLLVHFCQIKRPPAPQAYAWMPEATVSVGTVGKKVGVRGMRRSQQRDGRTIPARHTAAPSRHGNARNAERGQRARTLWPPEASPLTPVGSGLDLRQGRGPEAVTMRTKKNGLRVSRKPFFLGVSPAVPGLGNNPRQGGEVSCKTIGITGSAVCFALRERGGLKTAVVQGQGRVPAPEITAAFRSRPGPIQADCPALEPPGPRASPRSDWPTRRSRSSRPAPTSAPSAASLRRKS